jgi:hypothetical protein
MSLRLSVGSPRNFSGAEKPGVPRTLMLSGSSGSPDDLGGAEQAGQAEVDELGLRLAAVGLGLADDDVARLDVLVDEPEGVDVVEGAGQLDEDLDHELARGAAQEVLQGLAAEQLLREVHAVVVAAAEVVDGGEVRVVELGEQPELGHEGLGHVVAGDALGVAEAAGDRLAAHALGVAAGVRAEARQHRARGVLARTRARGVEAGVAADDLERDGAVLELVVSLVDGAEPTASEEAPHQVAAGDLVRQRRLIRCVPRHGLVVRIGKGHEGSLAAAGPDCNGERTRRQRTRPGPQQAASEYSTRLGPGVRNVASRA